MRSTFGRNMKTPSRAMAPLPQQGPITIKGWIIIGTLVAELITLAIVSIEWRIALGCIAGFMGILLAFGHRDSVRRSRERATESICTFARAVPAREHDTWVVRGVYEGLADDRGFPIRPGDSLEDDLRFLPEDFEDLVPMIATRAGRSMNGVESNPLCGEVRTVRDLILFLEQQPRIQDVTPNA